jgi:cytochrome c1
MFRLVFSRCFGAFLFLAPCFSLANSTILSDPQHWSWQKLPFGSYDPASLKRGFEVFRQVCFTCHGANLIAYRNLESIGLTEEEIKAFAQEREVLDFPNAEGEILPRLAVPADRLVPPFPNEQAARVANNGAYPVDLSLITKARKNGPDYIYNLLMGYGDNGMGDTPPEGLVLNEGMYYNSAFLGNQIAMPPPLMDGLVSYSDETEATRSQMAKDVVTFLNWMAEPELEARKSLGLKVLGFVSVLTVLLYSLKRRFWKTLI